MNSRCISAGVVCLQTLPLSFGFFLNMNRDGVSLGLQFVRKRPLRYSTRLLRHLAQDWWGRWEEDPWQSEKERAARARGVWGTSRGWVTFEAQALPHLAKPAEVHGRLFREWDLTRATKQCQERNREMGWASLREGWNHRKRSRVYLRIEIGCCCYLSLHFLSPFPFRVHRRGKSPLRGHSLGCDVVWSGPGPLGPWAREPIGGEPLVQPQGRAVAKAQRFGSQARVGGGLWGLEAGYEVEGARKKHAISCVLSRRSHATRLC